MTTEPFNIVIAYEDLESFIRANEVATNLASRIVPEIGIICKSWKFDFLANQRIREEAVAGASQADMVIIAANGGDDLPVHLKTWLEDWMLQRKEDSVTLVALLNQPPQIHGEEQASSLYLRQMAQAGRLSFFCQPAGQRPHDAHYTFQSNHQEVMPAVSRVNNYRGWGIND